MSTVLTKADPRSSKADFTAIVQTDSGTSFPATIEVATAPGADKRLILTSVLVIDASTATIVTVSNGAEFLFELHPNGDTVPLGWRGIPISLDKNTALSIEVGPVTVTSQMTLVYEVF